MEINPAFVIVLTILGAYFAGILGFIVILPATMAVIRLFRYFRDNAVDERLSIGPPSDL
jgi:predicted PurR-regulated permease PerM